jgi:hypothetical protein
MATGFIIRSHRLRRIVFLNIFNLNVLDIYSTFFASAFQRSWPVHSGIMTNRAAVISRQCDYLVRE